MNNIQNIIVYLWFLPALGFIVLPLFWSICGMLYRVIERTKLADIRGFVALNDDATDAEGKTEKRSRPRIHLQEGKACVDEECDCCRAEVYNISKQGLCLHKIPRRMYLESESFRIVFRTRKKDYSLMARPRWKKMAENGYVVGAEIVRIPEEWKDLVHGLNKSLAPAPA